MGRAAISESDAPERNDSRGNSVLDTCEEDSFTFMADRCFDEPPPAIDLASTYEFVYISELACEKVNKPLWDISMSDKTS